MIMKRFYSTLSALVLALAAFGASVSTVAAQSKKASRAEASARVSAPLNLAVLIQDDLVSRVGNELRETAEFIRTLRAGSRVVVGSMRSGSLQVRHPFTEDLDAAARSLRIPVGSTAVSAFNPYIQVRDAIKQFPTDGNRNAVLLVSDGLDTSRGFDFSSSADSIDPTP